MDENVFVLYNVVARLAGFFVGISITPLVYYFCSSDIKNEDLMGELMYEPCFIMNLFSYCLVHFFHYILKDPHALRKEYETHLNRQYFLRKNLYNVDPLFPMIIVYLIVWGLFECHAHSENRNPAFAGFVTALAFTLIGKYIYSHTASLFCCWDTLP